MAALCNNHQKIEELIHSINTTNTALEKLERTKKERIDKDYWAKKNKLSDHRYISPMSLKC
jgi:hypothetical protein